MSAAAGRQEWFAVSELVGLPGLPGTVRGVTKKATREDWQRRTRQARGGGWEYHFDSLPAAAQDAIRKRRSHRPIAEHPDLTAVAADLCAVARQLLALAEALLTAGKEGGVLAR